MVRIVHGKIKKKELVTYESIVLRQEHGDTRVYLANSQRDQHDGWMDG